MAASRLKRSSSKRSSIARASAAKKKYWEDHMNRRKPASPVDAMRKAHALPARGQRRIGQRDDAKHRDHLMTA